MAQTYQMNQAGPVPFDYGGIAPRPLEGGYSRFVAVMKLVLPLIAAVLIGLVIAWPRLYDMPERVQIGTANFNIAQSASGHRMVNARFSGTDQHRNPYTLTAESILQSAPGSDVVTLNNPEADFTTGGGAWIAVAAKRGRFAREAETITLDGEVSLFHDSGYEFRTSEVTVDFSRSTAWSESPISGHGPAASVEARGFRIRKDANQVDFTGPARVVFYSEPVE